MAWCFASRSDGLRSDKGQGATRNPHKPSRFHSSEHKAWNHLSEGSGVQISGILFGVVCFHTLISSRSHVAPFALLVTTSPRGNARDVFRWWVFFALKSALLLMAILIICLDLVRIAALRSGGTMYS